MYVRWRNKFHKKSSLRFLELNLDVTRMRLSLEAIKNFNQYCIQNKAKIQNSRKRHFLN